MKREVDSEETSDINIFDWIDYRPNVGVEGLHIIGLPGTGKSIWPQRWQFIVCKKGNTS